MQSLLHEELARALAAERRLEGERRSPGREMARRARSDRRQLWLLLRRLTWTEEWLHQVATTFVPTNDHEEAKDS